MIKKHFKKAPNTTRENDREYQMTDKFHICNILYTKKNIRKSDYYYTIEKYTGYPHQSCNANHRIAQKILF